MNSKYNSLDLFKFVMSLFVITIHVLSVKNDNSICGTIMFFSVPFFFMCCGYLLFENSKRKKCDINLVVTKYIKKVFKLYLLWSAIYLPITIFYYFNGFEGSFMKYVMRCVKNYIFVGQQYFSWPLWYLLCTIYSLLIFSILKKKNISYRIILIISVILVIMGELFTYFVTNIDQYNGIISMVVTKVEWFIGATGGRMFSGLFYICIGMLLSKNSKIMYNKYICLIMSVLLMIVYYFTNIFIFKIIIYILLFMFCTKLNLKDNKIYYKLRKMSTILYFSHMYFVFGYMIIFGAEYLHSIDALLIIIVVSVIFAIFILFFRDKKNSKIINYLIQ